MRLISRFRRWLDRLRTPQQVYYTPAQYGLYRSNSNYRSRHWNGKTTS